MVVLVLVLVWIAVLIPLALRKRDEWEQTSSVSRFHESARRLAQSYPHLAYQAGAKVEETPEQYRARLNLARRERERLRALRFRRRRTLTLLVALVIGSFLFGAIPALRPLWDLGLVGIFSVIGYLAMVVRVAREEAVALERARRLAAAPANAGAVVVPLRPSPAAFVIVEATS